MSGRDDLLFTLRVQLRKGEPCIVIRAYDGNHTDPKTGHMRIDVTVMMGGVVVFPRGEIYCAVNRWTSIDGIEARELVMALVAMKPGDTESEYFANYTPAQLDFALTYGEELDCERERRYCDENGNLRGRAS